MTFRALIAQISNDTCLSEKDVRRVLDSMTQTIKEQVMAKEVVNMNTLGRFKSVLRRSTNRRNMITGKRYVVPAYWTAKFVPSKSGFPKW